MSLSEGMKKTATAAATTTTLPSSSTALPPTLGAAVVAAASSSSAAAATTNNTSVANATQKKKVISKKIAKEKKQKEPEPPIKEDKEEDQEEDEEEEDEHQGGEEAEEGDEEEEEEEEVDDTTPQYHYTTVKHKLLVDKVRHEVHMHLFDTACAQLQEVYETGSLLRLKVPSLDMAMLVAQQQNDIDQVAGSVGSNSQNHMVKTLWQHVMSVIKRLRKLEKDNAERQSTNSLYSMFPYMMGNTKLSDRGGKQQTPRFNPISSSSTNSSSPPSVVLGNASESAGKP